MPRSLRGLPLVCVSHGHHKQEAMPAVVELMRSGAHTSTPPGHADPLPMASPSLLLRTFLSSPPLLVCRRRLTSRHHHRSLQLTYCVCSLLAPLCLAPLAGRRGPSLAGVFWLPRSSPSCWCCVCASCFRRRRQADPSFFSPARLARQGGVVGPHHIPLQGPHHHPATTTTATAAAPAG